MSMVATNTELRNRHQRYLREDHFLADKEHLLPLTFALFQRLAKGDPVAQSDLADDLGLTSDAVNALVSELPKSTLDTDEKGAIVAFGGLSQIPANHLFVVEGQRLHVWCVFDALFLPQLLSKSAVCETNCPTTQQRIVIELAPAEIKSAQPAQPVMSIVAPGRDERCDNIRGAYCNHVNFFVDEDAYDRWAADRTDVTCVSLDEAQELANLYNHSRYGDKLCTT